MAATIGAMPPPLAEPTWSDFRAAVRAQLGRQLEAEAAEAEALRARILPVVREAVQHARAAGEVGRVWLFGSFAWGQPDERSDVDLLVEACPDPFGLAAELWSGCGRPVHAVPLEGAPASLVERARSLGVEL